MQGDVSFDNIGRALLQVLQVVSLESWSVTQMYYLLDGGGYWVVVYYLCLIVIGTYFALNLLVAVISAKFAQLHVSPFCCPSSSTMPLALLSTSFYLLHVEWRQHLSCGLLLVPHCVWGLHANYWLHSSAPKLPSCICDLSPHA